MLTTFLDSNAKYLPDCEIVQYSINYSDFTFMNVHGDEVQVLFNITFINPGYHFIILYELKKYYITIHET